MMGPEAKYCRGPLAWMFNHSIEGARWDASFNVWLPKTQKESGPVSTSPVKAGRPDGVVVWKGVHIDVECKAGFNSFPFEQWTTVQRNWWINESRRCGVAYYLALWIHNGPDKGRIYQSNAILAFLPAEVYALAEEEIKRAGKSSISFREAQERFKGHLIRTNPSFSIPPEHPIWREIQR